MSPDDAGFGADNLPYGVDEAGHVVVAWRHEVIDLVHATGLDVGPEVWASGSLNAFFALGPDAWAATRAQLQAGLADQPDRARRPRHQVRLVLPWEVGDYADFYASLEHASNMGRILRPDGEPLPPAWRHLPIGYHGRAGTVVASGSEIPRPAGLIGPGDPAAAHDQPGQQPEFGPTRRLDVEVELGFVIGSGVARGQSIPVTDAERHVFGVVLVNDWSARDIQAFEYQPLGPFLGKSFATSVSPWVVPLAALEPWRVDGPVQQPEPSAYLKAGEPRGYDVGLQLSINDQVVSTTSSAGLYWSMAQQLAHLTVNGSGVRAGDLLASGTISGPTAGTEGSLMELTGGGRRALRLGDGTTRTWLADGDKATIRGWCGPRGGPGWLSLGDVNGTVVPCGQEVTPP
jgi:fumarylacetoacetase